MRALIRGLSSFLGLSAPSRAARNSFRDSFIIWERAMQAANGVRDKRTLVSILNCSPRKRLFSPALRADSMISSTFSLRNFSKASGPDWARASNSSKSGDLFVVSFAGYLDQLLHPSVASFVAVAAILLFIAGQAEVAKTLPFHSVRAQTLHYGLGK